MRDRLIALMNDIFNKPEKTCPRFNTDEACMGCQNDRGLECDIVARYADYLLENGVIVPLLQTGQTVYRVSKGRMWEVKIWKIEICGKTVSYIDNYDKSFLSAHIGKGVFFTKEEAEAKLKEGARDGRI